MSARNLRAVLAADAELGAGNVLLRLAEHGADPEMPRVTFDTEVDGIAAWTPLSLRQLTERAAARAGWFARHGIGRSDPVAVYVTSAADVILNYFALTWLGAIPALVNGNMPTEIAVEFIRRLRSAGVLIDSDHAHLAGHDLGAPIIGDAAQTGTGDPAAAPAHYRHHPDDPVAITHSSGTTRMPAAVVHSHHSLFAAVRAVRLTEPRQTGPVREMSVFPQAHTAGLIIVNEALCNGYELLCLSGQGMAGAGGSRHSGAFASSGEVIIDAIERWRPTAVFGFAITWSELARFDLSQRDVSSVRIWANSGDTAHEAHVRRLVAAGSHHVYTRDGIVSQPGSRFNDSLGSTEMGYGGFQITHTHESERYDRCVGKPVPFAEIILIDPQTGQEVPDGEVGMVAMKAPSLALGYWNDSATTFRTRRNGYYLTGDLMYRDDEGYFYHLDRASDAVDLGNGKRLYSVLSEERILKRCRDVRDCTVLAARAEDGTLVAEVLLLIAAGADPALDREAEVRAALGDAFASVPVQIATIPDDGVVVGPTGKVRKFLMRQQLVAAAGAREGSS
ncbi:MAG TPA: class I adenylate-forming enzyme family protein [Streptosporangiaceae bacterium]|nr:class I adenylate-forming enzyme family protein [Streptosporangiaceae bacterium]